VPVVAAMLAQAHLPQLMPVDLQLMLVHLQPKKLPEARRPLQHLVTPL
jgi:hypothetical protein